MNSNNLLLIPLFLLLLAVTLGGCNTQALQEWSARDAAYHERMQDRFDRQMWRMDSDEYRHRQVTCQRWGRNGVICNG